LTFQFQSVTIQLQFDEETETGYRNKNTKLPFFPRRYTMKKRFLALTLALTLCSATGGNVHAAAAKTQQPHVVVNDTAITLDAPVQVENGTTYIPFWDVVKTIYPAAVLRAVGHEWVVTAPGFTLRVQPGRSYIVANERYLYLPRGLRYSDTGTILVPSRILGAALGSDVSWDPVGHRVIFTAGNGPIAHGSVAYDPTDLYWLSRIIFAESGNQSMSGKIAVGNVVLNRIASADFPDTVPEVIFQKSQFSPVEDGSLYCTPNEESVIAAKLCLDGANIIGKALYFFNPHISGNCWAARNRPYVATIGEHAFYA